MSCTHHKPLAFLVCCGLAGAVAISAGEVRAQAMTPLRVDPVLLGLPPAEKKPAPRPAPAKEPAPAEARSPAPVETATAPPAGDPAAVPPRAEIRTVESQAVENRPLERTPAAAPAPVAASPATIPTVPAVRPSPATAAGGPSPLPARPAAARETAAASAASSGAGGERSKVTTLAPLQVHPGLLGQPAGVPTQLAVSPSRSLPSRKPAAGSPPSGVPKVTTLAPLRVHPGLLGQPVMADAAGAGGGGTPVRGPATLAGLAQDQAEAWRAGHPPVLAFADDVPELLDDGSPLSRLRLANGLEPLPSDGLPRPMFLAADELTGSTEREMVARGRAEARQAGTVIQGEQMIYWPVEDEIEATGDVLLEQGGDRISGPRLRMKIASQTGVFDEPTFVLNREAKWVARERKRQERGGRQRVSNTSEWSRSRFYRSAWEREVGIQALASQEVSRPEPGSLMNVLGVSSEPPSPIPQTEAHGSAERIDFEGENRLRIIAGSYTTCKPDDPGWEVRSRELALDYDREVGEGQDSTVYFKDTPIFWTPWLSFSLNNQRKSGFLAPTAGSSTVSGLMLATPYYWNIAPNMDATISPRIYSKRGVQLATEFRYRSFHHAGVLRAESLPSDRQADGLNRYGYSFQHSQYFGRGFSGELNLSGVSDDKYFTDLATRSMISSQRQLLRRGVFSYSGDWWNAALIGQSYQTLNPDDDARQRITNPYSFAPRIEFNARRPDFLGSDFAFFGQYTAFAHDTKTQGQRTVAYPQLSLPFVQPGWHVTPKFGVHATNYSLDRRADTWGPDSISRTLPIFSVDAGMTFERDTTWFGADATQTLEPRLFYLNVPYRDQRRIPNFDSSISDFNMAQIFSENQFLGYDRVSDANQLTAAVVSRLIDPTSGAEAMRAMFGQRYYFRRQEVDLDGQNLPGQTLDKWNRSDFLAAFSGRVLPKTWLDAALQYNPSDQRSERSSVGVRYQPELGRTLNASYRFASKEVSGGALKNVDVSGQWPIWGGWSAVGRYNYSILDHKVVEALGGLEYNGGCWSVRLVGHEVATLSDRSNTSFFIQLVLNDFARIGTNPIELLRRNIQGYGLSSQPVADPVFGE